MGCRLETVSHAFPVAHLGRFPPSSRLKALAEALKDLSWNVGRDAPRERGAELPHALFHLPPLLVLHRLEFLQGLRLRVVLLPRRNFKLLMRRVKVLLSACDRCTGSFVEDSVSARSVGWVILEERALRNELFRMRRGRLRSPAISPDDFALRRRQDFLLAGWVVRHAVRGSLGPLGGCRSRRQRVGCPGQGDAALALGDLRRSGSTVFLPLSHAQHVQRVCAHPRDLGGLWLL
mmetsp:Transcript_10086/g.27477  ORF Transcript_10086/g.27477 Transcript_10086/m.27477 type:complete len:234 (+) Transcript_10086:540-1241(+)